MKKLYTGILPLLLFIVILSIFILVFPLISFGQFIPVKQYQNAMYLSEPFLHNNEKYLVRSELDTFYNSGNKNIYVPYKTLTDYSYQWPCHMVFTNNWLGDSIVHQVDSGLFKFFYTPVQEIPEDHTFYLTASRKFSLPVTAEIDETFVIDSNINAEVKSISQINWEGEMLNILTYTITHDGGNPQFRWLPGEIRISDKYNIFNFPNLQYFPYDWRNCTLAGVADPKIGTQDLPNRDIYRMDPGDELTGTPVNVDSLLSNIKTIQLDVAVFPNPSSGNFTIEAPQNIQLKEFYLIDIQGKRNKIKFVRLADQQYRLECDTGNGIYMLQSISNDGRIYNLGKVVLIK